MMGSAVADMYGSGNRPPPPEQDAPEDGRRTKISVYFPALIDFVSLFDFLSMHLAEGMKQRQNCRFPCADGLCSSTVDVILLRLLFYLKAFCCRPDELDC